MEERTEATSDVEKGFDPDHPDTGAETDSASFVGMSGSTTIDLREVFQSVGDTRPRDTEKIISQPPPAADSGQRAMVNSSFLEELKLALSSSKHVKDDDGDDAADDDEKKDEYNDGRKDGKPATNDGRAMRMRGAATGKRSSKTGAELEKEAQCQQNESGASRDAIVLGQSTIRCHPVGSGYYPGTQAPSGMLHTLLSSPVPLRYLHVKSFPKTLHLAALTSLKGEIIELNTRLQQTLAEKELIEKQLHKYQTDKLRLQRECEERLEQQTVRYEDRITELHSVIAELQKKFDRHHINVIREEDEEQYEESDGVPSNRSAEELSLNENNANESQSASLADIGNEINAELSRVVSQLESAISESQQQTEHISGNNLLVNKQDKAIQVCPDISTEPMEGLPANMADIINRVRFLEKEVSQLQQQNVDLQTQVGRQETELNKLRAQNGGLREEKERLKSKVKEYQSRLHSIEAASPRNSTTSTPTKHHTGSRSSVERSGSSPNLTDHQGAPVSKVAELKKIKTWTSSERPVLGTDLTAMRLPMNAKVAEHLVQKLKESSDIQEIAQYANKQGADVTEPRIKEFEIEVERLQSKIDHLKSQNDLTCLSLAESKAHCDRLTVLIGKYESNHTAMQLALSYCDQALEAYQVLVSLLDSENTLLLSKCRAAGLANYGFGADTDQSDEDIATIIQNAQSAHKSAENIAKQLLLRLDRSNHSHFPGSSPSPWEDISSNSRTTSTTSSTASSVDTEWTKLDEQKLRECIQQLQMERASVKTTVLELESVHIDPMLQEAPGPSPESQKLDLENAVLMQELMAIKEERAELKSMNYVLDKEKTSLELKIFGLQCKEEAYQQRIKDLQMEIAETKNDQREAVSPSVTVENMKSMDTSQILQELHQALHREKALKARVKELINSLEYMSQNSEYRHQQSTAFINDLKKANSALIEAFEKAKKKYQAKLKKQETQIQQLKAKYEQQVGSLVYTIQQLKSESTHRAASETSL